MPQPGVGVGVPAEHIDVFTFLGDMLTCPVMLFALGENTPTCIQKVKPYLEAEMRSRGAKVIAWDGTWATAKRVNSGAKVLVCMLNENSHVVSYALVPSEKWSHVLPMFMG